MGILPALVKHEERSRPESAGSVKRLVASAAARKTLAMAVTIRLRREGTTNRPYYKVVVADSRSPRDGKFIEILGTYDPRKTDDNSQINLARVDYWVGKGAQPSDTVRSLIKKNRKRPAAAQPAEAPVAAE